MSREFPVFEISERQKEAPEEIGSKYKFWIQHDELGLCLFKKARSGTGEDWAEKVAAELCKLLQLPHAQYELATFNGENGVISPSFVKEGTSLSLGNEILFDGNPKYPKNNNSPSEHTLEQVLSTIGTQNLELPDDWDPPKGIDTAPEVFVGYLMLDAWIGNTDRHHENWGKVISPEKVYLAPTYDHASSLGRELSDETRQERLTTKDRGFSVEAFVSKGRSCLYRNQTDPKPMKLVEAFQVTMTQHPRAAKIWLAILASISSNEVETIFNQVPSHRISQDSVLFAKKFLFITQERLLNLNFEGT